MLVSCTGTGTSDLDDSSDDEIRNGRIDTTHPNVIRVNSCSATLIAPRTVLSAAHCFFISKGQTSVELAPNIEPIKASFVVNADAVLPDHDLAVLTLDSPLTGIEPALMLRTAPRVGETVTFVGYGRSSLAKADGKRRYGTSTIGEVEPWHVSTHGSSPTRASIDLGDSGGPAFVTRNGHERVAGVASRMINDCRLGNTDCTLSEHARTDVDVDWIAGKMIEPLYDGSGYDPTPMPKVLSRIEIGGAISLIANQPTPITISAWAPRRAAASSSPSTARSSTSTASPPKRFAIPPRSPSPQGTTCWPSMSATRTTSPSAAAR
jgi:hypothetical protein